MLARNVAFLFTIFVSPVLTTNAISIDQFGTKSIWNNLNQTIRARRFVENHSPDSDPLSNWLQMVEDDFLYNYLDKLYKKNHRSNLEDLFDLYKKPEFDSDFYRNRRSDEFLGARGRRLPDEFLGARGRRTFDEFLGARGRRVPNEFAGTRGRRTPDEFLGARGKKKMLPFNTELRNRRHYSIHDPKVPEEIGDNTKRFSEMFEEFTGSRGKKPDADKNEKRRRKRSVHENELQRTDRTDQEPDYFHGVRGRRKSLDLSNYKLYYTFDFNKMGSFDSDDSVFEIHPFDDSGESNFRFTPLNTEQKVNDLKLVLVGKLMKKNNQIHETKTQTNSHVFWANRGRSLEKPNIDFNAEPFWIVVPRDNCKDNPLHIQQAANKKSL